MIFGMEGKREIRGIPMKEVVDQVLAQRPPRRQDYAALQLEQRL